MPSFASSNAFIAKCYAGCGVRNHLFSKTVSGVEGVREPDTKNHFHIRNRFWFVKLAYLLMNQIMKLCQFFPKKHKDPQVPFRIVVSDVARRNQSIGFATPS